MATATEIATRALKRLKVVPAGGTPSAADLQDAIEALEAMIDSWEGEGLSGDVLPLDGRFEQGVIAMLAVRLAEDYGQSPGPVLMRDAEDGKASIRAAFIPAPEAVFDSGLVGVSRYYRLHGAQEVLAKWEPATQYTLRQYVSNGANLYECITSGTSAASGGPTGTESEITDGTAVWCWRRVLGDPPGVA